MSKTVWKHNKIAFGGDYNPEQWDPSVWEEDMRLFRLAHVDTVTLNVFSWAMLQPDENTYSFEKLDQIMEYVRRNELKVVLATSTAAHPAWMARKYPEILRVEFNGMKRKFGGRHNSCPNSRVYRKYSVALASELAKRYKDYDNIIAWHISNEYGGECYCENCRKGFIRWAKEQYGTIEAANKAWNTSFWGHTFYDWDEIELPNMLSEHFAYDRTMFQGISLDYRKANSQAILDCFKLERDAVREHTGDKIPVTTNLMGFFKALDYAKWAKEMDFISWDNYPANEQSPGEIAMPHDLMRGIGEGKPFILMEQTPSVTNWLPYNALKRPGVMRLWSYQAIAHGSDSVMFFQMRRSIGACEKYHGALIDHVGHENTRVFREMSVLGNELEQLRDETLGGKSVARAAIYFDWENWWAIEYSAGPSCFLKYKDEIQRYYDAFHEQNIPVDFVGADSDLSQYDVLVAPILYMIKANMADKIREFVGRGGSFLTTFFSGYVNENDLVTLGGYPGELRDILGIWVEESDALPEDERNHFTYLGKRHEASLICDLLHCEGADVLASYEEDFYQGLPALTCNAYGEGKAYYVATRGDKAFYRSMVANLCKERKVASIMETQEGLEVTMRKNDEGQKYLYILNHNSKDETVEIRYNGKELLTGEEYEPGQKIMLEAYGVAILKLYDE